MFQKYPFECSRIAWNPVSNPIGFSGDELLDLFYNVRNFTFSIQTVQVYSDPLTIFLQNGGANGSVTDALAALSTVTASLSGKNSDSGISKRSMKNSGEVALKSYPSVCGDYPVHTFDIGLNVITMDLGFIAKKGSIYYPTFSLKSSDGTLLGGGSGGLFFGKYGALLLSSSSGAIITGSISEKERFDNLEMSKTTVSVGDEVTISTLSGKTFTGFTGTRKVFVGGITVKGFEIGRGGSSITFEIPDGAVSDYATFENATDRFQSPVPFVIKR